MAENIKIVGDIDKVYTNANVECMKIASYIYSKGDIKTNKVSNKFCNIEILKDGKMCYLAITSGRLGSDDIQARIKRFASEIMVKNIYLDECKKRLREGYNEVEVISIYPNCSAAAKGFVTEKNVLDSNVAKGIIDKNKELAEELKATKPEKKVEVKAISPKVSKLVETIYAEANQTIKKSINPEQFQSSENPLGMINHKMILRGREILKQISEVQNKLATAKRNIDKLRNNIAELSNMYNMTIPRVINRGSSDWLLDTGEKLMEQYDLLEILEVGLSNAVLNTNYDVDTTTKYKGLNSEITLVTDEGIFNSIKEKMKKEQLDNHHLRTRLVNVYEVNQLNAPQFDSSCGNVVSLFHGTRGANLLGILSTSIKLPANLGPNIQLTGAMFGPGVYFGEYSKALQYSTSRFGGTRNKGNRYFLLLCDVALGKMHMEMHARNFAHAPTGCNSVMGVGQDAFKYGCDIKGIGGTNDLKISKEKFSQIFRTNYYSLLHNEFIVYNQNRYKIRYIVEVEIGN